jgi:hypothetical protein
VVAAGIVSGIVSRSNGQAPVADAEPCQWEGCKHACPRAPRHALTHATAPGAAPLPVRGRRRSLPDEAGVILALIALVAVIGILRPNFLQPATLFQWHSEIHDRWGEIMNPLMEFRADGIVDSSPLNEVFHLETNAAEG